MKKGKTDRFAVLESKRIAAEVFDAIDAKNWAHATYGTPAPDQYRIRLVVGRWSCEFTQRPYADGIVQTVQDQAARLLEEAGRSVGIVAEVS